MSTSRNRDLQLRLITICSRVGLNCLDYVHSFDNLTENNVLTVQPLSFDSGQKKLTTVRVFTSIRHRQPSSSVVLKFEVFVVEFGAPDRFTAGSVAAGEIAALDHEVFDDSVETAAFVPETFGARGELAEVFHGFWHGFTEKADFDGAGRFVADSDVEDDFVGDYGAFGGLAGGGQEGGGGYESGEFDHDVVYLKLVRKKDFYFVSLLV